MLLKGAHDNVVIYLCDEKQAETDSSAVPCDVAISSTVSDSSDASDKTLFDRVTQGLQLSSEWTTGQVFPTTSDCKSEKRSDEAHIISDAERVDPCAGNLHVFKSMINDNVFGEEGAVVSVNSSTAGAPANADSSQTASEVYALDKLQSPGPYPSGVDANVREQYLTTEDFASVFAMTKSEFNTLPKWKQSNMKKKHSLF